ncbi:MAG: hypothetical protein HGA21_14925, partial [Burkholderiaceae bacterium]|nr:hypothetical protein [Burkholderiaceae bacterium]
LVGEITRLIDVLALPPDEAEALREQLATRACTLAQALKVADDSSTVAFDRVCAAMRHGFEQTLNIQFKVGQLSVERYMKCGFGICGQCALDDLLVCIDGPVLTLDQLEGKRDFGHWHRGPTGRRLEIGD